MQVRFALIVATLGLALAASTPAAAHISKKPNAQKAIAFLEMVFNQKKVKEGFDKYVGDKYIQHNPIAADGKEAAVEVTTASGTFRVGGIAKGSGMIEPLMATMLGVVTTDAQVAPALLQRALAQAVDVTFNAITVDGEC